MFGRTGLALVKVLGCAHLDHPQKMAAYPARLDEPYQFVAGEPTLDQQIIEPYALSDGLAQHLYHALDLGGEIFAVTFVAMAVRRPFLGEPPFSLGNGKPFLLSLKNHLFFKDVEMQLINAPALMKRFNFISVKISGILTQH